MASFLDFITSRDFFGKPISLTYKGEDKFRTLRGGIMSILVCIGILYYTVDSFVPVFNNKIEAY
jgi:hypothetical protein